MKTSTALPVLALAADLVSALAPPGPNHPETQCCFALSKKPELKGKVFGEDSQVYDDRLSTYYSANAAQAPWCMVFPESTKDVSAIAKTLSTEKCPFGMRSGAHSAFAGSNGIKDGVTVDFGNMNTTTYDSKAKLAKIQPGSNWEKVYTELDAQGVISVGGRASVVGVGGFTSGGGYSFHTSSQGFACDNVVNFEVVLADGKVVNANAKENPDLWKALKGGSGNFGFITRIDQSVVEQTRMWGGLTTYSLDRREELFQAYYNFVNNQHTDEASQNIVATIYNSGGFFFTSVLSNIDAVNMPSIFNEYLAIESLTSTLRVDKIAKLVPEFTGPTPLGLYANWMAGMVAHDLDIMTFINDKQQETVAKIKELVPEADFEILLQFQPVTEGIVAKGKKRGGNSLGLDRVVKDGPALLWLIALTCDNPENQEVILPIVLAFRDEINAYADETNKQRDWVFLNYGLFDQDPISHYGAENVAHLKATSKKFDPKGVFQTLRKTGFKLPA